MDKNIRKDRKQGLQIGEEVILDADFNNSSTVKIVWLGKHFAIVSADGEQWSVMKYRLTKKIDRLTDQVLNSDKGVQESDTTKAQ